MDINVIRDWLFLLFEVVMGTLAAILFALIVGGLAIMLYQANTYKETNDHQHRR